MAQLLSATVAGTTGFLALAAALPLAARTQAGHADPQVVEVVAREYAFEMPDTLHAGVTTFRLRNTGREAHHIMLYRLSEGHTLRDVYDALAAGGAHPAWMHAVGGPNATIGPRVVDGTVDLVPGRYVVFCHIPSPDHRLHFSKGMLKSLVVTPFRGPHAELPAADVTVTLSEYGFRFSRPLTRGRHRIAVTNRGSQPHELILSRLAPGKSNADFLHWMDAPDSPPPVTPWGGATDLAHGRTIVLDVDLAPGRYSLLCRVRDALDGRTHDLHNMAAEVEVP